MYSIYCTLAMIDGNAFLVMTCPFFVSLQICILHCVHKWYCYCINDVVPIRAYIKQFVRVTKYQRKLLEMWFLNELRNIMHLVYLKMFVD